MDFCIKRIAKQAQQGKSRKEVWAEVDQLLKEDDKASWRLTDLCVLREELQKPVEKVFAYAFFECERKMARFWHALT